MPLDFPEIDGRLIRGERNKGIRVRQNDKTIILRDYSGKPRSVNSQLITLMLDHGYTPVICIPIADETNTAINSENDDIVRLLQAETQAGTVIQLIEAPGFLDTPTCELLVETHLPSRVGIARGKCRRTMNGNARARAGGDGAVRYSRRRRVALRSRRSQQKGTIIH